MSWNNFSTLKTVTVKQEGRHAVVTLARPNRSNALDDLMWAEIPQVAEKQGHQAWQTFRNTEVQTQVCFAGLSGTGPDG